MLVRQAEIVKFHTYAIVKAFKSRLIDEEDQDEENQLLCYEIFVAMISNNLKEVHYILFLLLNLIGLRK